MLTVRRYGACLLKLAVFSLLLMVVKATPRVSAETPTWKYTGEYGGTLILPFPLERIEATEYVGWLRKSDNGKPLYSVVWAELTQPNTITPEEIMRSLFRDRKGLLQRASSSTVDFETVERTHGRLQVTWCEDKDCYVQRIALQFRWNRGIMLTLTARLQNREAALPEWDVIERGVGWQL